MISEELIKIASNTSNEGLKNIYTFKTTAKNTLCGDKITIELIIDKSVIKSMKYETNACIYCEASASLLSQKIKNFAIKDIKKDFSTIKKISYSKKIRFPKKLSIFKKLFNRDNLNRIKCIILPFDAVLKALR